MDSLLRVSRRKGEVPIRLYHSQWCDTKPEIRNDAKRFECKVELRVGEEVRWQRLWKWTVVRAKQDGA